jgi:alkylation response protein AidB-like acyl-CoA dehydrogenase
MIELAPTTEQAGLVDAVRRTAAKDFPLNVGVAAAESGTAALDTVQWRRLAELGCFSLRIPEDHGGLGLGAAEELLIMIELGRWAVSGPLAGTALAASAVAATGEAPLTDSLMAGERTVGLLVNDLAVDAFPGALALRVDATGVELVELGDAAPTPAVDPLTRLSRAHRGTPVLAVEDPSALTRLRLMVGGYLVGLAEAATTMSAEYAKMRTQFGRPIGSFQAVKHRCAEMVIRQHPARTQLALGATLQDRADTDGHLEVAGGLLMAIDAAQRNVEDNIQNHGGIGFTAEHPAGVLVKRAITYRTLAGPSDRLVNDVLTTPRRRPS